MSTVAPTASRSLSRRSFLQKTLATTAATIAAPWIIPTGIVRAQGDKPVPSNRVTYALIGCGNMGPSGLENVLRNKNAQVIGSCDVHRDRAEKIRNRVDKHYAAKGCTAYQDFRELLARKDLDSVNISVPDHWHILLALAAVRAGKDVYLEKPLGLSVKMGKVLRDEINKRKTVFQFGTWQRARPHFQRTCELVRNGVIGDIKSVTAWAPGIATPQERGGVFTPNSEMRRCHLDTAEIPVPATLNYDMWLGPAPVRPCTRTHIHQTGGAHIYDYSLGLIAGWNIHTMDIVQWGLGTDATTPISCKGSGRLPDAPGLFDTYATWDCEYQYANGIGVHLMDWTTAQPIVTKLIPRGAVTEGSMFIGTRGWISVDRRSAHASDPELLKTKLPDNATRIFERDDTAAGKNPHTSNNWDNFIACIKTRKQTLNPIGSAFNDDVICHLANAAVRTGRKINWDTKTETIVGDPEAEALLERPLRAPWATVA